MTDKAEINRLKKNLKKTKNELKELTNELKNMNKKKKVRFSEKTETILEKNPLCECTCGLSILLEENVWKCKRI